MSDGIILGAAGYRVPCAADGDEARRRREDQADAIDLVLIQKPVSRETRLRRVRDVLDGPNG